MWPKTVGVWVKGSKVYFNRGWQKTSGSIKEHPKWAPYSNQYVFCLVLSSGEVVLGEGYGEPSVLFMRKHRTRVWFTIQHPGKQSLLPPHIRSWSLGLGALLPWLWSGARSPRGPWRNGRPQNLWWRRNWTQALAPCSSSPGCGGSAPQSQGHRLCWLRLERSDRLIKPLSIQTAVMKTYQIIHVQWQACEIHFTEHVNTLTQPEMLTGAY